VWKLNFIVFLTVYFLEVKHYTKYSKLYYYYSQLWNGNSPVTEVLLFAFPVIWIRGCRFVCHEYAYTR